MPAPTTVLKMVAAKPSGADGAQQRRWLRQARPVHSDARSARRALPAPRVFVAPTRRPGRVSAFRRPLQRLGRGRIAKRLPLALHRPAFGRRGVAPERARRRPRHRRVLPGSPGADSRRRTPRAADTRPRSPWPIGSFSVLRVRRQHEEITRALHPLQHHHRVVGRPRGCGCRARGPGRSAAREDW